MPSARSPRCAAQGPYEHSVHDARAGVRRKADGWHRLEVPAVSLASQCAEIP